MNHDKNHGKNHDNGTGGGPDGGRVPPLKPFSARGQHGTPEAPNVRKPAPEIPVVPKPPHATARADAATALGDENARLHVARDVRLSGAITSCDKLMVDGHVEADLPRARVLVVGVQGRYAGRAEVEHADIAGVFDGELTVTGRLTIRSTGRVHGTVGYGRIMVETGGEIAGESRVLPPAAKTPDTKTPEAT